MRLQLDSYSNLHATVLKFELPNGRHGAMHVMLRAACKRAHDVYLNVKHTLGSKDPMPPRLKKQGILGIAAFLLSCRVC